MAAVLFGLQVPPLASAANLAVLGQGVRGKAQGWAAACARLQNALEAHAATLGVAEDSPRLVTARSAAVLVSQLGQDHDDLTTAVMLADAELPEEAQALAKSISSADQLARALEGAQWSVLDAVAGMDTDRARACLADLRTAAQAEEFHAALQPALGSATLEASQYLASNKPPKPDPTPTAAERGRHPAGGHRRGSRADRHADPRRDEGSAGQEAPPEVVAGMTAPDISENVARQFAGQLVREATRGRVLALKGDPERSFGGDPSDWRPHSRRRALCVRPCGAGSSEPSDP
jgi:hypothetical protein